jgi:hypothetical protein
VTGSHSPDSPVDFAPPEVDNLFNSGWLTVAVHKPYGHSAMGNLVQILSRFDAKQRPIPTGILRTNLAAACCWAAVRTGSLIPAGLIECQGDKVSV